MKYLYMIVMMGVTILSSCNSTKDKKENAVEEKAYKEKQIKLEGAINFRDLGGLPLKNNRVVKEGLIYRADKLSKLTAHDHRKLDSLNIVSVIDFRSNYEVAAEPDTLTANMQYFHFPIGDEQMNQNQFMDTLKTMTADQVEEYMLGFYKKIPLEFSGRYKEFFQVVSNAEEAPLVYHCTAGKDRTGIASALLLYVLGADTAVIYKNYEMSNYFRKEENQKYEAYFKQAGLDPELSKIMMGVKKEYLKEIFSNVEKQYGSMDKYLEEALDVTAETKFKLIEIYTEKAI